jgi:hypothetical protein
MLRQEGGSTTHRTQRGVPRLRLLDRTAAKAQRGCSAPGPVPAVDDDVSASLEGRRSYAEYADGHLVCGDIRAGKAAATTAAKLVSRT